jgi:rhodanese-related sulfurtransferase
MDGSSKHTITASQLYEQLGTARAPIVLDVRLSKDIASDDRAIVAARRRDPEDVGRWSKDLPASRSVVVYCVHGRHVSQGVAAVLRERGLEARFLEDGIAGWRESALPTRRMVAPTPGKWVTRERPKIDRIACPWLISRFIDPEAEFIYVPAVQVLPVASETGATPYDIDGVTFTHEGERCSFDTILRIYDIHDAALDHLAAIVRGADTSRHDLSPQCAGLFAISLGLSANFTDDHEMLAHGLVMYDALYTWCRSLQTETHNWPPNKPVQQAAQFARA